MKMKRAKTNVAVFNKVNGEGYLITKVEDGEAIAERIIENPNEDSKTICTDETDTVKITENNAICFRLVNDPNIPDIPTGYTINNDGILKKDGKDATEQGELKLISILGDGFPGKLLLSALPKNKEEQDKGRVDLFWYYVERDRFVKVLSESISGNIHMYNSSYSDTYENRFMLVHSGIYKKIVKEEEEEKEKEYFDCSGVLLFSEAGDLISNTRLEAPLDMDYGRYLVAEDWSFFYVYKDVNKETKEVTLREQNYSITIKATKDLERKELHLPDIEQATICQLNGGIAAKSKEAFLYDTYWDEIKFTSKKVMEKLKGFDYLIDVSSDKKGFCLMFANENYNVKVVKSVMTSDRGQVITVEDFDPSK